MSPAFKAAALLTAAAIIAYQILIPPIVGLAENGDFSKITRQFDLAAPGRTDDEFKYVFTKYTFDPSNHWDSGYRSSEALLFIPALLLNWIVSKDGTFDIRVMGITHAAVFLLALRLLLPVVRSRVLLGFILLVFCDVMYVCYYNSFYMDVAAFLFLLLTATFFLRIICLSGSRFWDKLGLLACCILLVSSKGQHSTLAILIAIPLARTTKRLSWIGVPLLLGASLYSLFHPPGQSTQPLYNLIFYKLLPSSRNPGMELRELGLDESYQRYSGTHSYVEGSPMGDQEFVRTFSNRTSHGRLAWFYLRYPSRALHLLRLGLEEAAWQRVPNLGNFDKSVGLPPYFQSQAFSAWSKLKRATFENHGWRYFLYYVLLAAITCVWPSRMTAGAWGLALMTLLELLIGALADGAEVARHLFLFNACLDVMFLAALSQICTLLRRGAQQLVVP